MSHLQADQVSSLQQPVPEFEAVDSATSDRVEAFILLGGGLTASPLAEATHCSVLDLLVGPGESTVLDRWLMAIDALRGPISDEISIIIASGGGTPAPSIRADQADRRIEVVFDKQSYRGAAGVVCDVSSHLDDSALLLVAEAARCPNFDLSGIITHHRANSFDATVLVNPDDTPAGVYVIPRGLLRYVQREGYMDLKEQWLNKVLESDHRVGAIRLAVGYSHPLRTHEHLLQAARAASQSAGPHQSSLRFDAVVSNSHCGGTNCIASGASVHESAIVVDSIIMPGASIGASSIVTRSIVCSNAVVPSGARVVDSIVGSEETVRVNSKPKETERE